MLPLCFPAILRKQEAEQNFIIIEKAGPTRLRFFLMSRKTEEEAAAVSGLENSMITARIGDCHRSRSFGFSQTGLRPLIRMKSVRNENTPSRLCSAGAKRPQQKIALAQKTGGLFAPVAKVFLQSNDFKIKILTLEENNINILIKVCISPHILCDVSCGDHDCKENPSCLIR